MLEKSLEKVAILDFGGQYTHLIARRVRSLGVWAEIFPPDKWPPRNARSFVGIILSGGPGSVGGKKQSRSDLLESRLPVLGICYGHQLLAHLAGGEVEHGTRPEYGLTEIRCDPRSPLFRGLPPVLRVWMSHADSVKTLPNGFSVTATSESVAIAAFECAEKRIYGCQFHPEVSHTERGNDILENFVGLCTRKRMWRTFRTPDSIVEEIRSQADGKNLVLLVSGGVDSMVCLWLSVKAVGPRRVFPIHVDTGFMREGESRRVVRYLEELGLPNVIFEDASSLFLGTLRGVTDPEEKRRLMGALFVDIVRTKLGELGVDGNWKLIQGTIYPDTIESGGTRDSDRIKTHHNRVPEMEELIRRGDVIEPLKHFYKDEVRAMAREVGLPTEFVERHPFPGPGLAIRILASKKSAPRPVGFGEEPLDRELEGLGIKGRILPIRSVGVQGDRRTYGQTILLWFEKDGDWGRLLQASAYVVNRHDGLNRSLFSVSHPRLDELFLRRFYLTEKNVNRLRKVDEFLTRRVEDIREIWQMPVVALPLFDKSGRQVFVMRPVCSEDGMTADCYRMDFDLLARIEREVCLLDGVACLFYDTTTKPPGTIEWE